MSKSIGQIVWDGESVVYEADGWGGCPWDEMDDLVKAAAIGGAKALLAHAAAHLRSLGEQEKTYALQDCMERAAMAIEELE